MIHILRRLILFVAAGISILLFLWLGYQTVQFIQTLRDPRSSSFLEWARGDQTSREQLLTVQKDRCPGAPFILPADGYIGLLYGDPRGPYSLSSPHQGIDIFSNADPGIVPVYAAYDGFVTREDHWVSSLIMRVPDDPQQPGRQIWLYYTHMANQEGEDFISDAFPPGIREKFVTQGTLLGYTGDYNGSALRDIWVHLHFSIVLDNDSGSYRNELEFNNTLDPSPYLGMAVNHNCATMVSGCSETPVCPGGDGLN